MENVKDTYEKSENNSDPNAVSHYKLLTIGTIIGIIGVFLRFAVDSAVIDMVSNIIFVIGSAICLKAVLDILK